LEDWQSASVAQGTPVQSFFGAHTSMHVEPGVQLSWYLAHASPIATKGLHAPLQWSPGEA
jgi:hypothetical protein